MLPIIIRSTEEILKLVPDDLRRASDAVGRPHVRAHDDDRRGAVRTSRHRPSGVMLAIAGVGRGEQLPLLFTIGAARKANFNVFEGPNTALSVQIFRNANQPVSGGAGPRPGAAFTLIMIVFICTIIARVVSSRFATRTQSPRPHVSGTPRPASSSRTRCSISSRIGRTSRRLGRPGRRAPSPRTGPGTVRARVAAAHRDHDVGGLPSRPSTAPGFRR